MLKKAKSIDPSVLTVLGGPNFHADEPEWIKRFLSQRPQLDLYLAGEGEWSFTRLVKLLKQNGGELGRIPFGDWPASFYALDHRGSRVMNNPSNLVSRLDLATVPSPYLTGLLDPFLDDERLIPIIESNRGCPYACAFCCWGNAIQSKVNPFKIETVIAEIRYITERTRNPWGLLYIADANFGILKRDQEIAGHIKECAERFGFPKRVTAFFAKNATGAIVDIADTLKPLVAMGMARQSLNEAVLAHVGRRNIKNEGYEALRDECEHRGIGTMCELIYGLPSESYESFVAGVSKTVRGRATYVTIYPHFLIAGAETSGKAYRERFKIESAYRVQMRAVGSYDDFHSLEYEEFVVATKDLPVEDFYRLRMFHFLFVVLGDRAFRELRHALDACGLDHAVLADGIVNDKGHWTPLVNRFLSEFRQATRDQLIGKEDLKLEFTEEDIKAVAHHQIALNPYFLARLVATPELFREFGTYAVDALGRLFGDRTSASQLHDLRQALRLSFDKLIDYRGEVFEKHLDYDYDVDGWLETRPARQLGDFRLARPVRHRFAIADEVAAALAKAKSATDDLIQALYIVRVNLLALNSGEVYSYRREPVREQATEFRAT